MSHLLVDEWHIILLSTKMLLISEASIAAHAGIDLVIAYRHDFYMVFLRGSFDECLHQQIRIAALPRAS